MSMNISIIPVTGKDIPILANICTRAMAVDLVHRAMFPTLSPLDTTDIEALYQSQLYPQLENPNARFFKAVASESKDHGIVGYIMVVVDDKTEKRPPQAPEPGNPPAHFNPDFQKKMIDGIEPLVKEKIADKPNMWLGHLMVKPEYQHRHVGTQLMQFFLQDLGGDKYTSWLVTQVRSPGFYKKFGFKEDGYSDLDLSEFMGPDQGYGSHRSVFMTRPPGSL